MLDPEIVLKWLQKWVCERTSQDGFTHLIMLVTGFPQTPDVSMTQILICMTTKCHRYEALMKRVCKSFQLTVRDVKVMHMPPNPFIAKAKKIRMDRSVEEAQRLG